MSGYFVAYSGPVLNGPMVLIGALFDSKAVPLSAVSSLDDAGALRRYHGLGFSVMNTSRVAYSPVILKIRNRSHLVVTGRLDCMGHGIRPTAIRLIAG